MWLDKLPRLAEKAFTQFWVLLIITPALAISTWSLATLAIDKGHLPIALAVCISAIFDGAALGSYHIALQWQREHNSFGLSAQLAAFLFAASSCYLNWSHGILLRLPIALCYLLAAPSAVTLLMLEVYLRLKHRGNVRKRPMPHPELAAFLLFPLRSYKLLRSIVGHRMSELETNAVPVYNVLANVDMKAARAWLQDNGFQPGYTGRISRELLDVYAKAIANQSNGHKQINGKDLKELTDTTQELNLIERY